MYVPALIGGTPFQADFAPSIFFAILYGMLIPTMLYRGISQGSRSVMLLGTMFFSVERVVVFFIRALQSYNPNLRVELFLITYMQNTLSIGYITIASNLANSVRCLLVNPTYGSDTYGGSPAANSGNVSFTSVQPGDFPGCPPAETQDHPRTRFWARRFTDFISIGFLSAIIEAINANFKYGPAIIAGSDKGGIVFFRYSSAAVSLSLILLLPLAAIWAHIHLPRVSKRGVWLVVAVSFLLSVIPVYRLSVMFNYTNSLVSTGPGSLNSTGSKVSFYILHVFPEWLAMSVLCGLNIKRIFATGTFGDWRFRDETPKGREKREKKEAERAREKGSL